MLSDYGLRLSLEKPADLFLDRKPLPGPFTGKLLETTTTDNYKSETVMSSTLETETRSTQSKPVLLDESGQLNSRPDLRFPHPTERPGSIVVIFDGKCRFCTSQVRTLQRLDFAKRLSFISLHDPHVALWWPALTYDQLMAQIYVIPPNESDSDQTDLAQTDLDQPGSDQSNGGELDRHHPPGIGDGSTKYGGAEGFRFIAWRLPALWPAALVLSIPFSMPLWKSIYDFIARQRYRFGKLGSDNGCGPDGTCELHFGDKKKK